MTATLHSRTIEMDRRPDRNVLGGELKACSYDPLTGFYRNGCCSTGPGDFGVHTVCVICTDEFLTFSQSVGNDLSTPHPAFGFSGLKAGDRWCLCAPRWQEALESGFAPLVVLEATHEATLEHIDLQDLIQYAIDPPQVSS